MTTFWIILAGVLAVPLTALAGFYAVLGMAKRDFLWTTVEQGWYKLVMRYRRYHRTFGPGFHWLGWPGVYTLYSRKMVFKKCVVKDDGGITVEDHNDPNITSFKSTTYPYAIPFKDEEDSQGLPLSGVIALHGRMIDPVKAFFSASDWYLTMVTLVISALRQVLTEVSWEQITGQNVPAGTAFGQLLWDEMNEPREGGKPSVIAELKGKYGVDAESVELASIDPPEGWRATTLAPYKAQKEKEAAVHRAAASAAEFDDTNQALTTWRAAHPGATQVQIEEKQEELRQRALAKTSGYQQVHIKGLENATTAVVGGGGAGVGIFAGAGGGKRDDKKKKLGDMNALERKRAVDSGD